MYIYTPTPFSIGRQRQQNATCFNPYKIYALFQHTLLFSCPQQLLSRLNWFSIVSGTRKFLFYEWHILAGSMCFGPFLFSEKSSIWSKNILRGLSQQIWRHPFSIYIYCVILSLSRVQTNWTYLSNCSRMVSPHRRYAVIVSQLRYFFLHASSAIHATWQMLRWW